MNNSSTLVSATELAALISASDAHANVLVVDCRFDLADPARGAREYARAHGAIAHARLRQIC